MELRRLGRTGPRVSAFGLGFMGMSGMYGPADRRESIATIDAALDSGINPSTPGISTAWGTTSCSSPRHAGRCARALPDQREVRRPARAGRQLARLRRAA